MSDQTDVNNGHIICWQTMIQSLSKSLKRTKMHKHLEEKKAC